MITLEWYRDFGRGQEAAEAVGATQTQDGAWPLAVLPVVDHAQGNDRWQYLLDTFGVNATTETRVNARR